MTDSFDEEEQSGLVRFPVWPEGWSVRKRAAIVRDLAEGRRTIDDIARETGLSRADVADWLPLLNQSKSILTKLTRGQTRPSYYLFPQSETEHAALLEAKVADFVSAPDLRSDLLSRGITTFAELADAWPDLPASIQQPISDVVNVAQFRQWRRNGGLKE